MADETQTEQATDTAPSTEGAPTATATAASDDLGDAGKKALDEERRARRESERARKDLERRLREYEAANQTETERAQAAATAAEQRAQAAVMRIASAEVRAALTGVVPDPAAVAEDLDLARFIDAESGDVNTDAVAALKAKYAALAPPQGPRPPAHNPAQGAGGAPKSLAEVIADAEKASTGSKKDTLSAMRLKSRMALGKQQ